MWDLGCFLLSCKLLDAHTPCTLPRDLNVTPSQAPPPAFLTLAGPTPPALPQVLAEDGTLLFRGLRVKMGLTFGVPQGKRPSAIGRADYQGPMLSTAAACVTVASPGQVLLGGEAPHNAEGQPQEVALDEPGRRPIDVAALGQFRLRGVDAYTPLFSVSHPDLVGRSFSKPPGQVVISGSAESDTGGTVWDAEQHGTQCEQDAAVANSFANAVQEAMASKTTKYRADESVEIQVRPAPACSHRTMLEVCANMHRASPHAETA